MKACLFAPNLQGIAAVIYLATQATSHVVPNTLAPSITGKTTVDYGSSESQTNNKNNAESKESDPPPLRDACYVELLYIGTNFSEQDHRPLRIVDVDGEGDMDVEDEFLFDSNGQLSVDFMETPVITECASRGGGGLSIRGSKRKSRSTSNSTSSRSRRRRSSSRQRGRDERDKNDGGNNQNYNNDNEDEGDNDEEDDGKGKGKKEDEDEDEDEVRLYYSCPFAKMSPFLYRECIGWFGPDPCRVKGHLNRSHNHWCKNCGKKCETSKGLEQHQTTPCKTKEVSSLGLLTPQQAEKLKEYHPRKKIPEDWCELYRIVNPTATHMPSRYVSKVEPNSVDAVMDLLETIGPFFINTVIEDMEKSKAASRALIMGVLSGENPGAAVPGAAAASGQTASQGQASCMPAEPQQPEQHRSAAAVAPHAGLGADSGYRPSMDTMAAAGAYGDAGTGPPNYMYNGSVPCSAQSAESTLPNTQTPLTSQHAGSMRMEENAYPDCYSEDQDQHCQHLAAGYGKDLADSYPPPFAFWNPGSSQGYEDLMPIDPQLRLHDNNGGQA